MIEDEKLKFYVDLMSEIMALQSMLKVAKQNGLEYADMDRHLVFLNNASHACVAAMNRRLKEIGNYD